MPIYVATLLIDQYADFPGQSGQGQFTWIAGGLPVSLVGATARMMARVNPSDVTPLLSISTTATSDGSIVLGGAAGTVAINITKARTAQMVTSLPAFYDLLIDWPNGTSTDFLSGTLLVKPGATH